MNKPIHNRERIKQIMLKNLPVTVIDTQYWNSCENELVALLEDEVTKEKKKWMEEVREKVSKMEKKCMIKGGQKDAKWVNFPRWLPNKDKGYNIALLEVLKALENIGGGKV